MKTVQIGNGKNIELDQEIQYHTIGFVDLFLHNWAEGVSLYKRGPSTTDVVEIVEHNGPAIVNGHFRNFSQTDDGLVISHHPMAGRQETYTPNDSLECDVILLNELK